MRTAFGRRGRIAALERSLDHVAAHEGVWLTCRIDIDHHRIARPHFRAG